MARGIERKRREHNEGKYMVVMIAQATAREGKEKIGHLAPGRF